MYKPSELNEFLKELGVKPKKGLSQNFLIDGNIVRKIREVSEATFEDIILEIGPGPGALTEELLKEGAQVIAVEKDRQLAQKLERLQTEDGRLSIYCQDILTFPIQEIITSKIQGKKKAKVIANLPYHLTTPIISLLVPLNTIFSTLTLMVQEEVAQRFVAKPKSSEWSSISLFLNFYSSPEYAFKVKRSCFYPSPKVDSAIVIFKLKEPPLKKSEDQFFKLTRRCFQQRRKMITSSLSELYPKKAIQEALVKRGLPLSSRPEELSLEDFLDLFHELQSDDHKS